MTDDYVDLPLDGSDREEYPSRDAWLAARRNGIGGSDAPVVVGASRYSTPLRLWLQKLELDEPDDDVGEAAEWGLRLEPVVLAKYAEITGREILRYRPHTIHRSRDLPFMTATLDAIAIDRERGLGVVQAKTAGRHLAWQWEDEPPLAYVVQLQHEMRVVDARWGSIPALLGGQRFVTFDVERDDAFLDRLVERERRFFEHVLSQQPPPDDLADPEIVKRALAARFPRHEPGISVYLPASAIALDEAREEADEQIAAWKQIKENAENRLRELLGSAERGILPTGVAWSWKTEERPRMVATADRYPVRVLRRHEPKR